jgi:hypothetical protein
MDLGSIFGLNSRFGAVWEGFALSPYLRSLNIFVYQRVLGYASSDLLEDCAPALPVICPSAVIVALAESRVCESAHSMM